MTHNLLIFHYYVIKYLRPRIKTDLKNRQQTLVLFSSFLFETVPIISHNKSVLHYSSTYANDINFAKWLTLKAFMIYDN